MTCPVRLVSPVVVPLAVPKGSILFQFEDVNKGRTGK